MWSCAGLARAPVVPQLVAQGVLCSSRRRHTRFDCDWSSDVCSSDLLFGFFYSGLVPIFPTLLGKFFGLSAMVTIYGFFGTSFCVAAIGGPLLAGYIHDITGSYFYPFLLSIFFCYAGAILSFFIKPPIRIIRPITSVS